MSEIRLYVEGGGDGKEGKARLRRGFQAFLQEVRDRARQRRIRWSIIPCGSRDSTLDDFRVALLSHPHAFNVLLVDADGPQASQDPWQHLRLQHSRSWTSPGDDECQCHLMVQVMEAWFLADRERLQEYYGRGFHANALPKNEKVENIDKQQLERSLKEATRPTQKGAYHKILHGSMILERIRLEMVRRFAPSCDRLFRTLAERIEDAS